MMTDPAADVLEAPATASAGESLTAMTMQRLRARFAGLKPHPHRPSSAMWSALEDVAGTMTRIVDGEAAAKYYLSSLDPGVGKTETLIQFFGAMSSLPKYDNVGVLICLARLDEISAMAERMGLEDFDDFACYTADDTVNTLGIGKDKARGARVLFTTHSMVMRRLKEHREGGPTDPSAPNMFADLDEFHYLGRPRLLRVWDEALMPGLELTVSVRECFRLAADAGGAYPGFYDGLTDFLVHAKKLPQGSLVEIPNWEAEYGVSLNDLFGVFDKTSDVARERRNETERDMIQALIWMQGHKVALRNDGKGYGNAVLDYHENLPPDLAPVVILDASGRVRQTYPEWAEGRGDLVELKRADKKYDRLTIHVQESGGGKSGWELNRRKYVAAIADVINDHPDQNILVVHHKISKKVGDTAGDVKELLVDRADKIRETAVAEIEKFRRDLVLGGTPEGEVATKTAQFEAEVQALIEKPVDKAKMTRVYFTTWGRHDATNEHVGCSIVILAGTLFYRPSYYEALGRAAGGIRAAKRYDPRSTDTAVVARVDPKYPKNKFYKMRAGEHANLILQALCRGSVRLCDGVQAHKCDAYIIAAAKTGIPDALPGIFPGCEIVPWGAVEDLDKRLTGKTREAVDYILNKFDMCRLHGDELYEFSVTFKEVIDAIGPISRMTWSNIHRDDHFRQRLHRALIVEHAPNQRPTEFILLDLRCFDAPAETDDELEDGDF